MKRLETFAEGEFDTLYAKHKRILPSLRSSASSISSGCALLPAFRRRFSGLCRKPSTSAVLQSPEYDKHLFLEEDNKFRADLGTWEQEVLQEELAMRRLLAG
jgi:type III restriction enzyme